MMKHKLKFYWYKLFGKLYYHDIDGWHTGAGGIVIEYQFYYVYDNPERLVMDMARETAYVIIASFDSHEFKGLGKEIKRHLNLELPRIDKDHFVYVKNVKIFTSGEYITEKRNKIIYEILENNT